MSGTPSQIRFCAAPVPLRSGKLGRVVKASSLDVIATPPAVLTYPVVDRQGDLVDPDGIDWGEFDRLGRVTNYEHGPPVGIGELVVKALPGPDGALVNLPVGTTTFFQSAADLRGLRLPRYDQRGALVGQYDRDTCLRYAEKVAGLVADGVIDGVSIEFRPAGQLGDADTPPIGPFSKSLGRRPYHFRRTHGLGWATCNEPVNDDARFLEDDGPMVARAEKAFKAVYEGGGLEHLPLIRKSLTPLANLIRTNPTGRVTAAVRRAPMATKTAPRRVTKADMYEDEGGDMAPAMGEANPDMPAEEPMADDMTATAAAAYQAAQGLLDLCGMIRDQVSKGEHVKGRKKLEALCDKLEADAEMAKSIGDMVKSDVGGGDEMTAEPEPTPVATDDDTGEIVDKSFGSWRPARVVFEKAGRRFKVSDLRPPVGKKGSPPKGFVPESEAEWAVNRIDELESQLKAAGIQPR